MIATNIHLSQEAQQILIKAAALKQMGAGMIILDPHIWIWWNQDAPKLTSFQKEIIDSSRTDGIEISTISLLEISRLVNRGRLVLPTQK